MSDKLDSYQRTQLYQRSVVGASADAIPTLDNLAAYRLLSQLEGMPQTTEEQKLIYQFAQNEVVYIKRAFHALHKSPKLAYAYGGRKLAAAVRLAKDLERRKMELEFQELLDDHGKIREAVDAEKQAGSFSGVKRPAVEERGSD